MWCSRVVALARHTSRNLERCDQPDLFAEADRIRAESELRAAVVPPLFALVALLATEASLWWLVALVPVFQLLIQGVRREDDARRLIGTSLLVGRGRSGAVERFDRQLEALRDVSVDVSR